ncbi:hypothetical protein TUMSATVNIG1_61210 (plasmid) [Vibrio nigripulchritudo]|uniref:hypothetical protein n=1 Tax=Vibrio nigripulchritudo TaxID=28173 RepID=UPI00190DD709|nr:hypothetical protein [Vibrio nigripulchritudo]BCL74137.1 hypothetical protein VNTUMSATTG_60740 [Vibrio nigripulchritudo]BDU35512.1 hypothetical protein TUMSATVNIG1_61210 [Vibrio nigripulchritudo]
MVTLIERIETLAKAIEQDTASLPEVVEWMELTSNGNPIKDKAISKLKTELSDAADGVKSKPKGEG